MKYLRKLILNVCVFVFLCVLEIHLYLKELLVLNQMSLELLALITSENKMRQEMLI